MEREFAMKNKKISRNEIMYFELKIVFMK